MVNLHNRLAFATMLGFLFVGTSRLIAVETPEDRTIVALEQDLKADPGNASLWAHLGFAYRKAGKIAEAQGAFEKAVGLDARNTESWYMLGLIYESQKNDMAARRAWESYLAAEKDPEKRAVAEKHLHHLS